MLGGEQSGHIVHRAHATTGDGIIAALQVLAALVESGKEASEALRLFRPVPQLLRYKRTGDIPEVSVMVSTLKADGTTDKTALRAEDWHTDDSYMAIPAKATLLHAIAATVMIIGVIVHVYAAIWVKGSLRAMTRGTVSDAWARKYHAAWHREIGR